MVAAKPPRNPTMSARGLRATGLRHHPYSHSTLKLTPGVRVQSQYMEIQRFENATVTPPEVVTGGPLPGAPGIAVAWAEEPKE